MASTINGSYNLQWSIFKLNWSHYEQDNKKLNDYYCIGDTDVELKL